MSDIAKLTLGNADQVPEEILQLTDYSPVGVVNPDQANWLLLVHRSIQPESFAVASSQS
jgi:hypothetical protein